MSHPANITIPQVTITFDQLLTVVRRLEPEGRSRLAQALADTELDARLSDLITRLAAKAPADDVSDAEIDAEIRAVRQSRRN